MKKRVLKKFFIIIFMKSFWESGIVQKEEEEEDRSTQYEYERDQKEDETIFEEIFYIGKHLIELLEKIFVIGEDFF